MTPRERFLLIVPGVLFLVAFGAFELGRLTGKKQAARKHAAEKEALRHEEPAQSDIVLIQSLLAQNLDARTFQLPDIIEGATGHAVKPFDSTLPPAATILAAIRSAAEHALEIHNAEISPIRGLRRINEGSRFFEDSLRSHIDAHPELFCTIPSSAEGKEQRSGYPDLRIEHVESGTIVYLDPKLFEETSRDSSLRSFYYTPRTTSSKIHEDAHHLLLGISHDGKDGQWTFTGWELIDLSRLRVRLKPEIQASNRDLYRDEAQLAKSRPPE